MRHCDCGSSAASMGARSQEDRSRGYCWRERFIASPASSSWTREPRIFLWKTAVFRNPRPGLSGAAFGKCRTRGIALCLPTRRSAPSRRVPALLKLCLSRVASRSERRGVAGLSLPAWSPPSSVGRLRIATYTLDCSHIVLSISNLSPFVSAALHVR
jgi:hypothetical protein